MGCDRMDPFLSAQCQSGLMDAKNEKIFRNSISICVLLVLHPEPLVTLHRKAKEPSPVDELVHIF